MGLVEVVKYGVAVFGEGPALLRLLDAAIEAEDFVSVAAWPVGRIPGLNGGEDFRIELFNAGAVESDLARRTVRVDAVEVLEEATQRVIDKLICGDIFADNLGNLEKAANAVGKGVVVGDELNLVQFDLAAGDENLML